MSFYKKAISTTLLILTTLTINNVAWATDPGAVAKYNQGIDHSQNGNYNAAITAFKESIAIDEGFTDAYFNLGTLYEYLGKENEALLTFLKLVKNNPQDSEAAYKVASIYYKKENYKRALSYITLVQADSPQYQETQKLYGKIVQKLNIQKQKNQLAQASGAPAKKSIIQNFQAPTGIAQDNSGNLYVANFGDSSIVKIAPSGQRFVIAKGSPLNGPIGLAIDALNNIYVANYNGNQVLKITKQGQITEILKNINKPYYLHLDASGTLFVSEQGSNSIIRFKIH